MPRIEDAVLLRGAWYSIEQAGFLIRDAAMLFDDEAHPSAVALAMFGLEELGRYAILRDLWRQAKAGVALSPDDVREACRDHEEKQRRGSSGLIYRATADTGFGKLLRSLAAHLPSSSAARPIRARIEEIDKQKATRLPAERHRARMRALYVDLNEAGSDWLKPSSSVTVAEAHAKVNDAANAYGIQRDRLTTPGILVAFDVDLARGFEALGDLPPLPEMRRPRVLLVS
jgi:AbiV family abortive infection protein